LRVAVLVIVTIARFFDPYCHAFCLFLKMIPVLSYFEGNYADYEQDRKIRLGKDRGHAAQDQVSQIDAMTV